MQAQHTKTAMDTAEMTRELLALARHSARNDGGVDVEAKPRQPLHQVSLGDRIKIYKGKEIRKTANGVAVDGLVFDNVMEAEKYISDLLSG